MDSVGVCCAGDDAKSKWGRGLAGTWGNLNASQLVVLFGITLLAECLWGLLNELATWTKTYTFISCQVSAKKRYP